MRYLLIPLALLSYFFLFLIENFLISTVPEPRPHIVVVLVDDLGWANVGYHTPEESGQQTPYIDELAQEGIKLERHYSHYVCSPSRVSFESGRLPVHSNLNNGAVTNPTTGIPPEMTGMGEKLKNQGYATYFIGKWDIGMATPRHVPTNRGYDGSLHYWTHANHIRDYTHKEGCGKPLIDLWEDGKPFTQNRTQLFEDDLFQKKIQTILLNHNPHIPLFLIYSMRLVHTPYDVPSPYLDEFNFEDNELYNCCPKDYDDENDEKKLEKTVTKNKKIKAVLKEKKKPKLEKKGLAYEGTTRTYTKQDCACRKKAAAMLRYVDNAVHNVTKTLKNKNMWSNTLFLFLSDNGGAIIETRAMNNYPLRGGKRSGWEGGIRVPAFVSGGYLPPAFRGASLHEYIHIADWYTTFTKLAGGNRVDVRAAEAGLLPVDGLDMWPLLSGKTTRSPRTQIHVNQNILINGTYKIFLGQIKHSEWTGPIFPNQTSLIIEKPIQDCTNGCLFNIFTDEEERNDLSLVEPLVTKEMLNLLNQANQNLHPTYSNHINYFPLQGTRDNICLMAKQFYSGCMGPYQNITKEFLDSIK